MNLLADLPQRNYPADYLLARLKGRQSLFITNWTVYLAKPLPEEFSETAAWRKLLLELRWVYGQMDKKLRKSAAPLFFFLELRTLSLCLRYKAAGEVDKIGEFLALSLLPDPLWSIMQKEADIDRVIDELADYFSALSGQFAKLPSAFHQAGLRGAEQTLSRCYLEYIVTTALHPAVKFFLQHHIDFRNIMGLAKSFRWETKTPPPFIIGGSIPLKRLERSHSAGLFQHALFSKKIHLARPVSGEALAVLENSLLKALSRQHQRQGRSPDPIDQIIDYLWRHYIETRNAGLLRHGATVSRNLLAAEFIQ